MKNPRVMIVGLDAATWDLVGPWLAEGHLPNLAQLISEGTSGKFQSVFPPITPPAWTSFTTGKNPGKHGIFHFMEAKPGNYALSYTNASSRRARTVWKILNEAGITTGITNIPFTDPPEKLKGYQSSGMDTPSEKSPFVYPPELREELEKAAGRPLQLDTRWLGFMSNDQRRYSVLEEMRQLDEQWTRVGLHLLQHRVQDVMMFVFMSIDTVQHYFWQFMDESHFLHDPARKSKFGNAVRDVYVRLDAALGKFLEYAGPDTSVFVVSDHGAGPVSDRTVYLNRYLAQIGLLHYRKNTENVLQKTARTIIGKIYKVALDNLSSRQKVWLSDLMPALRDKAQTSYTAFTEIDWTRTKAFCSEVLASPPSVWINLKGKWPEGVVEPADYEKVRDEVITKLGELKDPRTGEPVIKRVLKREEAVHGPFASEAADLILDWWETSEFSTSPSIPDQTHEPAVVVTEKRPTKGSEWGGTHRLHGILVAKGPHFKKNAEISGARLIDFAPTLLYLLGQPVPRDMDGKVLSDLFNAEYLQSHPVVYDDEKEDLQTPTTSGGYSDEEAAQVEERLRALGYVE
jgi:predicted AlkP superfamily phosphohydrolase/phosphomutase